MLKNINFNKQHLKVGRWFFSIFVFLVKYRTTCPINWLQKLLADTKGDRLETRTRLQQVAKVNVIKVLVCWLVVALK